MYLMLVFGIILTTVANCNVVEKDSTYFELRGNQVFKIMETTTIVDTSYSLNGESVNERHTSTKIFEFLETVVLGDTSIIMNYLTIEMYLKSKVGDTVFVHKNQKSVPMVSCVDGVFPYFYTEYFIKQYFLINGQLIVKPSTYKNIEIFLMIVNIVGFFILSFLVVFSGFSNNPNLRIMFFVFLIILSLLYNVLVSSILDLIYLESLLFMSVYATLPSLLFILFAYRKKAKFLNQFEAAKANLDR